MPFGFRFNSRHMAPTEVVSDLLQSRGENIVVVAAIVRSSVKLTDKILLKALKRLIRYQPALRMKISSNTSMWNKVPTKRFSEMNKVGRSVTIQEGASRNSWLEVVEEEMFLPLSSAKGPLWKLRYMEFAPEERGTILKGSSAAARQRHKLNALQIGSTLSFQIDKYADQFQVMEEEQSSSEYYEGVLIFKIHQAIADEVSLFDLFHQQFVSILREIITKKDSKKFSYSLHMIPAAEEAFDEKKKLSWRQKRQLKRNSSSATGRNSSKSKIELSDEPKAAKTAINTEDESSDFPGRASILPFALMPIASKAFLQQCRNHDVAFLSAFLVASAASLGIQSFAAGSAFADDIRCNFPIDLRQFSIIGSPYTLGMWKSMGQISTRAFHFLVSGEKFWKECARVDADIQKAMQKPYRYFTAQKRALKCLPKTRKLAVFTEMYSADLEVSVIENDSLQQPQGNKQSHGKPQASSTAHPARQQKNDVRSDVRSDDAGEIDVTLQEFYYTKSMSDISSCPISITATVYHSRIMCTVAYNAKLIRRSFATSLVDVLIRVINSASATIVDERRKVRRQLSKRELKYFSALPAFKRASLIS